MSVPYELTGRHQQKTRTRQALVAATRALLAEGANPTVEEAAAAAGISRTTAYRYFPNQRTLLAAAYPEIRQQSLLPENPPTDPRARLDLVIQSFTRLTLDWEPQLRASLRLSLEPGTDQPMLRQGRAIGWIEDALDPLRETHPGLDVHRLAVAIRSATGIEALIWLTDIAGLPRAQAAETQHWSAQAMLAAALAEVSLATMPTMPSTPPVPRTPAPEALEPFAGPCGDPGDRPGRCRHNLDIMEWTGQVYADTPTVAAQIYIEAPPERVWTLVSDIYLMPGLSAELREVVWLDGTTGPAVGCRFTGRNANAALGQWETVSTVVECDEPRRFAWAVGDPGHPWSTFRFTLRPDGTGTVLEQWMQMGPARSGLNLAIDAMPDKEQKIVFVRMREFETGFKHNLAAIKEMAERAR